MSLYISDPRVPRATIRVYPKRRQPGGDLTLSQQGHDATPSRADQPADVCYADFFRAPVAAAS